VDSRNAEVSAEYGDCREGAVTGAPGLPAGGPETSLALVVRDAECAVGHGGAGQHVIGYQASLVHLYGSALYRTSRDESFAAAWRGPGASCCACWAPLPVPNQMLAGAEVGTDFPVQLLVIGEPDGELRLRVCLSVE
jgi:hypothetical protein